MVMIVLWINEKFSKIIVLFTRYLCFLPIWSKLEKLVSAVAILIPYGLLLTFSAALFPQNIPTFVPLGELAKYLGETYPLMMQLLALFAAAVHVSYPFYVIKLSTEFKILPKQTFLWGLNGLFFGIFAIWPLVFYDFFLENATTYCNIPLAFC